MDGESITPLILLHLTITFVARVDPLLANCQEYYFAIKENATT